MFLTKREAELVMRTHAGNFTVWTKQSPSGHWIVELHVQERVYQLVTTRGSTKDWRQLADAIAFVQRYCMGFTDCFVAIGDWVLCKTDAFHQVEGAIHE